MPEMKDSGIDIINLVPKEWKKIRLKYICDIQTGNEDTQNANPEGEYPFYVRSPIVERCNRYTFDGEGILVAGDGAGAGRVFHYANGKYAVHQRVYRLANFKYNPQFLHYYLSNIFPYEMDKGSAQSTVPSMRLPMLQNFVFCLPTINESNKIVDFLEEKCIEIDTLTSDIQTQIDTLEQYKKSVITEAVTKGLNPDVEMKDSGIEWIGEIPIHWNVIPTKYCFRIGNGSDPTTDEGATPVYGSGSKSFKTCVEFKSGPTVLLGRKGTINIPQYVVGNYWNVDTAFDAKAIREYNLKLFYYCAVCFDYDNYSTQTALPSMTQGNYNNIRLPLMTIKEQEDIIQYLDEKCFEIDGIVKNKKKQLETLERYKKSLIYEYVTGKKEVPNE
ncbi:MAG: restriction endonuclease subunit S [Lachnospiraceae bacterium]|nr:restriction endonuclease subunit S [Lachnospiraceae bacterium]